MRALCVAMCVLLLGASDFSMASKDLAAPPITETLDTNRAAAAASVLYVYYESFDFQSMVEERVSALRASDAAKEQFRRVSFQRYSRSRMMGLLLPPLSKRLTAEQSLALADVFSVLFIPREERSKEQQAAFNTASDDFFETGATFDDLFYVQSLIRQHFDNAYRLMLEDEAAFTAVKP
jgi:hypothetical protein